MNDEDFSTMGLKALTGMFGAGLGKGGGRGGESYTPYAKTRPILDRAMEHIESVSYKVSSRWVFYRLLQEGLYSTKEDYKTWIKLSSSARHGLYDTWHPTTLADETRSMIAHDNHGENPDIEMDDVVEDGVDTAHEEIERYKRLAENYEYEHDFEIDPNWYHDAFCVIMFEARAMTQQFRTYTGGLTLCPFGGQPSIPYKWDIAKYIEGRCDYYDKDATVLYFGDLDRAGGKIFNAGRRDITAWCNAPITFYRCGLTQEQVDKYEMPENFEHPGFQWEALTDDQAREIIEEGLSGHFDTTAIARAEEESKKICEEISTAVNQRLDEEKEDEDGEDED